MMNFLFRSGSKVLTASINGNEVIGAIPSDYSFLIDSAKAQNCSLEERVQKELNSTSNLISLDRTSNGIELDTGMQSHVPQHTDGKDRTPVKRVKKFGGLSIGVTHDPGDDRFGAPMGAHYGHIRRTGRTGMDKLAIDAYLSPTADQSSGGAWRIRQVDPDTGSYDEDKYMLGFSDSEQARRCFIDHAGRDRFGTIEPADLTVLNAYREDSVGEGFTWVQDDRLPGGGYYDKTPVSTGYYYVDELAALHVDKVNEMISPPGSHYGDRPLKDSHNEDEADPAEGIEAVEPKSSQSERASTAKLTHLNLDDILSVYEGKFPPLHVIPESIADETIHELLVQYGFNADDAAQLIQSERHDAEQPESAIAQTEEELEPDQPQRKRTRVPGFTIGKSSNK